MVGLYAGVSQLARESGSYPECHWFESDRRYHGTCEIYEDLTGLFLYISALRALCRICSVMVTVQSYTNSDMSGRCSRSNRTGPSTAPCCRKAPLRMTNAAQRCHPERSVSGVEGPVRSELQRRFDIRISPTNQHLPSKRFLHSLTPPRSGTNSRRCGAGSRRLRRNPCSRARWTAPGRSWSGPARPPFGGSGCW